MTPKASAASQPGTAPGARRTRRQLLAGGTTAVAAAVAAEVLSRPAPASAADGGNLILGQANSATNQTVLSSQTGAAVLRCEASGGAEGTGLAGASDGGTGVFGTSPSGLGVVGISSTGKASFFRSDTAPAVYAESGSQKGVWGISGSAGTAFSGAANGVHGLTGSAPDSAVLGEHAAGGPGVTGVTAGAAPAVHGTNSGTGPGVAGQSAAGTGVSASGKIALNVTGPAVFSRSGKITIPAGKTSVTVTGQVLTSSSIVLATIQNDVPGAAIRSAVPAAGSFTLHLAKALTKPVTVGWFIVN